MTKVINSDDFSKISFDDFSWLNEPKEWKLSISTDSKLDKNTVLKVITDKGTDFWEGTWYNFSHNTGHLFGVRLEGDFTFKVCVEAEYTHLYDQAGLMVYLDDKHWLKTGIEFNDGEYMIGSVLTNELSDWATGKYQGNPRKFYLRLTRKGDVACVKYSTDNENWNLLRLCSIPFSNYPNKCFIGPMCCTPLREGLKVKFSDISVTVPGKDILHSN